MKFQKKLLTSLLAFTLVIGLLFIPTEKVQASGYGAVPTKIHITTGGTSNYFSFDYAAYGYSIKNLKSSNSNLKVKQTYQHIEKEGTYSNNYAVIYMYASKEGTYKITFDICDAAGVKVSSHTVKIYAYNSTAIKSVKLGSNNIVVGSISESDAYLLKGTSGKVKVSLTSGYTLKKIEYGVYNATTSDYVYTAIKNNKKVTYGTASSQYSYSAIPDDETNFAYSYWQNSAFAYTYISITYLDKYTKQESTITYPFYKWVK